MPSLIDVANLVVKRISALTRTATDADLTDSEYMAVDNASAYTRKITVASLATWILGRIKGLDTATEDDLKSDNYLALDGAVGTKRLPADLVVKGSDLGIVCRGDADFAESTSPRFETFYVEYHFEPNKKYKVIFFDVALNSRFSVELRSERNYNASSFIKTIGYVETTDTKTEFIFDTTANNANWFVFRSTAQVTTENHAHFNVVAEDNVGININEVKKDIDSIYGKKESSFDVVEGTDYNKTKLFSGLYIKQGQKVYLKFSCNDGSIGAIQLHGNSGYLQAISTFNQWIERTFDTDVHSLGVLIGGAHVNSNTPFEFSLRYGSAAEEIDAALDATLDVALDVADVAEAVNGRINVIKNDGTESFVAEYGVETDKALLFTGLDIKQGSRIYVKFDADASKISLFQFKVNNTYFTTIKSSVFNRWLTFDLTEDAVSIGITTHAPYITESTQITMSFKCGEIVDLEAEVDNLKNAATGLPSYYTEEFKNAFLTRIKNATRNVHNGISFVFGTDFHWLANSFFSKNLAKIVLDNTSVPFMLLGGDYPVAYGEDSVVVEMAEKTLEFINFVGKSRCFGVRGNHDFTIRKSIGEAAGYTAPVSFTYDTLVRPSELYVSSIHDGKFYYYIDVPASKTRVMMLCTSDTQSSDTSTHWGVHYNATDEQAHWLCDRVQEKTGWNFVFVSHISGDPGMVAYSDNVKVLFDVATAINNKTSVSIGETTHDFSNTTNKVVCYITGHAHCDDSNDSSNVLSIATTCDACYSDDGYGRGRGGTDEQALDVFVIDYDNSVIKTIRIGGGNDREFTF